MLIRLIMSHDQCYFEGFEESLLDNTSQVRNPRYVKEWRVDSVRLFYDVVHVSALCRTEITDFDVSAHAIIGV